MNATMKSIRAVLYARVSTDQQAEYGFSLPQQKDDLARLARSLNAEVVEVIEDAGLSGALYDTREGLQRALALIRSRRANTLLVHSTSRLSRDREHQSRIRREIERAGGRLIVQDMPVEDSPEGDLMLNIRGDFDVYERQVFRKRSKGGKLRQAKEGLQPARRFPPYGYHVVTKNDVLSGRYPSESLGKYQVVQDQAKWVREMFRRYAAGDSLRNIALWLHDSGVATPRDGRHWHAKSISDILKNPVHKGKAVYNKHETHTDEARLSQGYRGMTHFTVRPESDWVYIEAPAIVDEETWDACQERFSRNREQFGGNPEKKYLLVGLMKCPTCMRRMGGKQYNPTKTNPLRRYYRCREFHKTSTPLGIVCNPKHHNADFVDGLIVDGLATAAGEPEMLEAALHTFQEDARDNTVEAECEKTRKALADLERKEAATIQAQIDTILAGNNSEQYARRIAKIAEERQALEEQLRILESQRGDRPRFDPMDEALLLAKELSTVIRMVLDAPEEKVSVADKNRLLSRVIRQIVPREVESKGKKEVEGYDVEMAPIRRGQNARTVTLVNAFVW